MICHYYESHNHFLSEQGDCLYCEINQKDEEIAALKDEIEQGHKDLAAQQYNDLQLLNKADEDIRHLRAEIAALQDMVADKDEMINHLNILVNIRGDKVKELEGALEKYMAFWEWSRLPDKHAFEADREAMTHDCDNLTLAENIRLRAELKQLRSEALEIIHNEKAENLMLQACNKELEADALVMALRLLGEDDNSFGPECHEVMQKWGPIAMKAVEDGITLA